MDHFKLVMRALGACGRTVRLSESGEERDASIVKAVIRPLRYRNNSDAGGVYLPPGQLDGENYLYLGPPEYRLDQWSLGGIVTAAGERYMVRRARQVFLGEKPMYLWAILQKCHD